MMGSRAVHTRIDNRLLHGQIVQFWIPALGVERLVIADDEVARDPALLSIYRAAAPGGMDLAAVPVSELPAELGGGGTGATMVLLGEVSSAARARRAGFLPSRIVLGNVHAGEGRRRVTDAVHLSPAEMDELGAFVREGTEVLIQTLPGETLRLAVDGEGAAAWVKG
jgi:mannose/fructose/N-acetylgalactosamine-specific phosphotransferase system component IIB